MIKITLSPKIASKVSEEYWKKLFSKPTKNISWEPYEFHYSNIKKTIKPAKSDTILDVGSGGGELTYLFHKDGFNIKGFDPSESSLTRAKTRFGNNLFYKDDLINMKNTETKYTKIFLNGVFLCIHPKNYCAVLRNLYKITEDNGAVYIFNNPDYSKRNEFYSQFRTRTRILTILTFFFPAYKPNQSGFWVKTPKVRKLALEVGFSRFEQLESWSSHRTHYILYK
jgi:cyclopropane fatty-acyl-phospholipid synthase-like methyltransferase